MGTISNLSLDLVEDILSRVPLTCLGEVRLTCKRWNLLCKDHSFTKKHCGALVIVTYNCDLNWDFSKRFNLYNIKDLPYVKKIGILHGPVKIFKVYPCHGLLLCVTMDYKLVVWNPYLAQTRWIDRNQKYCRYAIGYDNNNNNHKVLRLSFDSDFKEILKHDIYDFKSDSWRVLDITHESLRALPSGVSLKGSTYSFDRKMLEPDFIICFDFTTERFGPRLHLPFHSACPDNVTLSSVRDEQLAVLFRRCRVAYDEIEFWITTKIEPIAVSWTKLFRVDMTHVAGSGFQPKFVVRSFYIDKEKKVAVVCGACHETKNVYSTSYVVGEDGNYEEIGLDADVFSYYPSSVAMQ